MFNIFSNSLPHKLFGRLENQGNQAFSARIITNPNQVKNNLSDSTILDKTVKNRPAKTTKSNYNHKYTNSVHKTVLN